MRFTGWVFQHGRGWATKFVTCRLGTSHFSCTWSLKSTLHLACKLHHLHLLRMRILLLQGDIHRISFWNASATRSLNVGLQIGDSCTWSRKSTLYLASYFTNDMSMMRSTRGSYFGVLSTHASLRKCVQGILQLQSGQSRPAWNEKLQTSTRVKASNLAPSCRAQWDLSIDRQLVQ